ncbi:DMT family transporter [Tateyamaria omphalii]|uniref:DMT family transporter n=1 Tax=Tateyamaria omphalii TaxID=299262 RepID=UPI001C99D08A|nr:DMT family transporter [Tateyamaria omphalii]MBY5931433.1 DMT family transporter [Tateyamaria omphalii]
MTAIVSVTFLRFDILSTLGNPLGPRGRAVALAGGAVLFWSTWPTLATLAGTAPPFLVFGLASAIGFAIALLMALAQANVREFVLTPPKTMIFVASALLINNILFLVAMPRIGPAEANVIAYLWPVMLVAILSLTKGERLTLLAKIGIGLGFVGAALAIGPTFERGFDYLGIVLAFLSGLTFAIYAAIRSSAKSSGEVIGPSMGVLAVMALMAHCLFEEPTSLSVTQWLAIAGIGIAPLTLSNVLWDKATRTGFSSTVSGIAYLTPIGSIAILAVFGAAAITWGAVIGALLVVIGAVAASGVVKGRAKLSRDR